MGLGVLWVLEVLGALGFGVYTGEGPKQKAHVVLG